MQGARRVLMLEVMEGSCNWDHHLLEAMQAPCLGCAWVDLEVDKCIQAAVKVFRNLQGQCPRNDVQVWLAQVQTC